MTLITRSVSLFIYYFVCRLQYSFAYTSLFDKLIESSVAGEPVKVKHQKQGFVWNRNTVIEKEGEKCPESLKKSGQEW